MISPQLKDSSNGAVETDETDETGQAVAVGNHQFLAALFGAELTDVRAFTASLTGDPGKAAHKDRTGIPYASCVDSSLLAIDANNYFSLAVFRPNGAGRYLRQKSSFSALHAVILDNVGTKMAADGLTLPPTWLLETSPSNFQAGYLLREPLTDLSAADRLLRAIAEAGFLETGANGATTRSARLPGGVNGKYSPPFQCRLQSWSPEVRYTVEELAAGLGLEMPRVTSAKSVGKRQPESATGDFEPVWNPRPRHNPVLVELQQRGLYKTPLGDAKHLITCPWSLEHTGDDVRTSYFEPSDDFSIGGFKCAHSRCAERRIRDLLQFVDIDVAEARMKSMIRVKNGQIHRVVDAAERALAESTRLYQRGGLIVMVVCDPGTKETRIQPVSANELVSELARAARWEKYDRRDGWVETDPPQRPVAVLFDSSSYAHLPVLNGLTRQPYLRPDGSLTTSAGFDLKTGMYGAFDAAAFDIPVRPTRAQAESALQILKDILVEFSFADDNDHAAALAALLTAAVRPGLQQAPLFHVSAPVMGSGKSFLCELISALATPQRSAPTSFPGSDEECGKVLLAELMRAPAVIEFDNLTYDLVPHRSLCTVLTSENFSGRILGVSKTTTVSTRTLFLSSGNNVSAVRDMTRRSVTITLDARCETPATRSFARPNLVREVLLDRGRYVSAALTVVTAWIAAGRPMTQCKPLAGFSDWTELVRQPLLWLGLPDPAESVFESMAVDPETELLDRLLRAWEKLFGNKPKMVREALQQVSTFDDAQTDLREVMSDIADERGEINRRKLGRWIQRRADRMVNGRTFVRDSATRSAEAWRVESVKSVSSVSGRASERNVGTSKTESEAYTRASRGE